MRHAREFLAAIALGCMVAHVVFADDIIEFLSGVTARGTVKEIRQDQRELDVEVQVGGRTFVRTYPFDQLHAVTVDGKREVLTSKGGRELAGAKGEITRSKSEVLKLINTVGSSPPDWLDATARDYPPTLDLDWPLKPPNEGWDNQRNVGQYKWDIINPNPSRWRSGVRLILEVMERHEQQADLLRRDMKVLAEMYFELFQDYPRAAFWLRKAGVKLPEPQAIHLAECYWRLGNEEMALDILKARRLPANAIKLLGDIGQTDRAVRLAQAFEKSYPDRAAEPLLLAGDACRIAQRYDQALDFYQRVLDGKNARNEHYEKIYTGRARDSIEAINLFDKADVRKVADGAYQATTTGYNGDVTVEVKVVGGRIVGVRVTSHNEKQFYAALTETPQQIRRKQSVRGIDATSRATITSQAIVNASAMALAKGTNE